MVNFTENLEEAILNLHKTGAFLTSKYNDKINSMTISWGNIGFQWNKPTFIVLVRESRYTKEFIDNSMEFTVSIPTSSKYKDALSVCGSKSGKNIDKYKECNLNLIKGEKISTPLIDCEGIHYECKVVFKQEMNLSNLDTESKNKFYSNGDNHTLYFGEILAVYKK